MAQRTAKTSAATRQHILRAALKRFAHGGYAATSVQHIVDDAKVSKPTLYYYFTDKARLFQALVDSAHDEQFRLIQSAAARAKDLKSQLVEILSALFEHFSTNRELTRIALATAFAAPGEVPAGLRYLDKCRRNFESVHALFKRGQAEGRLDRRFDSRELAHGFYGQMNVYVMAHLVMPHWPLDRRTAERIVELFLEGAAAKRGK